MNRPPRTLIALLLPAVLIATAGAQPPVMGYSGHLTAGGSDFDGIASMKFAIISSGTTLWSNDGTSTTGDEPTAGVSVTVDHGSFSVRLGDVAGGQFPLSADLLGETQDAALRVWVDTGSGFELLGDQPLSSAPFAMQSDAAERALGDFHAAGELQTGVGIRFPDDSLQITAATGGGGGPDSDWAINGSDMYAVPTGNVGIGTSLPGYKLHVVGTAFFQFGVTSVQIATPGGAPGLIAFAGNSHRRDIVFTDGGMRLVTSSSGSLPPGTNGVNITESGMVGIGTDTPGAMLDVAGSVRADIARVSSYEAYAAAPDDGGTVKLYGPGGISDLGLTLTARSTSSGAVANLYNGSGTATVQLSGGATGGDLALSNGTTQTIDLAGFAYSGGSQVRLYDENHTIAHEFTASNRETKVLSPTGTTRIRTSGDASGGEVFLFQNDGQAGVDVDGDDGGHGLVSVHNDAGTTTVQLVGQDGTGNGRVITQVLEITGGADMAESFRLADGGTVAPGSVVAIDPEHVGGLRICHEPYARTVAGVISGAGGVRPGMVMGQQGSVAAGDHPVALSGRVWTLCDTAGGPIRPGDLLTSSTTPGRAMRAADPARAQGAVLGKAMSPLAEGSGLVLVLVSLQ